MRLDSQWITGFVDGEGCFQVGIRARPEMAPGYQVLPEFTVVQHERDVQVLHALKAHFGCGVVRRNHGDRMVYRVRDHRHLLEHIVPFFVKHPLRTKKHLDFLKFRDVLNLMEEGAHLTEEGIERIRAIVERMS
jgi:hypothetical protein